MRRGLSSTGTFKIDKTIDSREGYDPDRVGDPLYFDDVVASDYQCITRQVHLAILSGAMRFQPFARTARLTFIDSLGHCRVARIAEMNPCRGSFGLIALPAGAPRP